MSRRLPPVAYVYDRCTAQSEQGRLILQSRLQACADVQRAQGWAHGGVFVDELPGALTQDVRPAFERLLGMMRSLPGDRIRYLLTWEWDRLSHQVGVQGLMCRRVRLAYGNVITAITGDDHFDTHLGRVSNLVRVP